MEVGAEVWLVDDNGKKQGEGIIEKVLKMPTKTNVARVKAAGMENDALLQAVEKLQRERYIRCFNTVQML